MPAATKLRGSHPKARPFFVSVLIISFFTACSFLLWAYESPADDEVLNILANRTAPGECRDVRRATDQCAFVLANCDDDEAGLLSYLTLYYCNLGHAQPLAFIILVAWLGLLFSTIGIAASDFFSVNLSTIASILGLSESLAGVTFLAFGNGSPDVFSTFAAMGSNSASMALGELIGAASFITAVVAGSMALVREFKVGRKTYVRDICFFIVAVCFSMFFLADGHLHLWECLAMIGYYVFYVFVVVGWHWYSSHRRQRREREAAARDHVYGSGGDSSEELAAEPYRDDPDDEDRRVVRSGSTVTAIDIRALERGPMIRVQGQPLDYDDDEEGDLGRHLAAEMASSMRVLRPRGRRSNTTITPIRPSLVGALEFRSALAHLQRESNLKLTSIPGRSYSDTNVADGLSSGENGREADAAATSSRHTIASGEVTQITRERALSSGDIPDTPSDLAPKPAEGSKRPGSPGLIFPQIETHGVRARSPSPSFVIGGSLAPPPGLAGIPQNIADEGNQHQLPLSPRLLQLKIPHRRSVSSDGSEPVSPFPGYTDSPLPMTPNPQADPSDFTLPPGQGSGVRDSSHFAGFEAPIISPRPVRWWPYTLLPPPHVLLGTLFPTLQGWSDKSIWDKFISAISVPSIFLLVITLPVVETEADDAPEAVVEDPPKIGSMGNTAVPVSIEPDAEFQRETEWQRYRRRTRSSTPRSSQHASPSFSPALIALDSPGNTRSVVGELPLSVPSLQRVPPKPLPRLTSDSEADQDNQNSDWNRWLVALQIFTGPLFATFILWANWQEDFEEPGKILVKLMLCSLLGSLILLAILLLTTSPDKRPKYHFLLCFLGFIISIAWISSIAGEVVGVLKTFGVVLGISEALLGLTVFAAGNSVGDLIADITVARLGYPVMAL
jgi:solute carrier family 24 (sodium/potassium/calcium exchanger), member 6